MQHQDDTEIPLQEAKNQETVSLQEKGDNKMTIYDIEAEIMECIDQETGEVIKV